MTTRDDLGGRGEDVAGVGEADAPQADADDDGARVGSGLGDQDGGQTRRRTAMTRLPSAPMRFAPIQIHRRPKLDGSVGSRSEEWRSSDAATRLTHHPSAGPCQCTRTYDRRTARGAARHAVIGTERGQSRARCVTDSTPNASRRPARRRCRTSPRSRSDERASRSADVPSSSRSPCLRDVSGTGAQMDAQVRTSPKPQYCIAPVKTTAQVCAASGRDARDDAHLPAGRLGRRELVARRHEPLMVVRGRVLVERLDVLGRGLVVEVVRHGSGSGSGSSREEQN